MAYYHRMLVLTKHEKREKAHLLLHGYGTPESANGKLVILDDIE